MCSIDAEYKAEERYSKLTLAYGTEDEKKQIEEALVLAMKESDLVPQTYTSTAPNGRKVLVIEYHDDNDREAGAVFEHLLKALDIKCC